MWNNNNNRIEKYVFVFCLDMMLQYWDSVDFNDAHTLM